MVEVKIKLDEGQNKIVNMCKLVNSLDSKEKAISKIIKDWGMLQSISDREIENKVIERWKQRYRKTASGDWIKRDEDKLKKSYKEYDKGIQEIIKKISKKFKKSVKETENILSSEEYEEGEDKFKDKVWDVWQNKIGILQTNLEKKYQCEINHEEGGFETRTDILGLKSWYGGGKEVYYNLDIFIHETIDKVIKILRGSKSLRDIMDENKAYLERMEKEADNITSKQEEELEAKEELMGV